MGTKVGYIKLYRKALDSDIWANHNLWRFFEWCLMSAAYQPTTVRKGYQKVHLEPGQLIYSRALAASETGLSVQTVRTCLKNLTSGSTSGSTSELTKQVTNRITVITVVNWACYQNGHGDTNQPDDQQSNQPTNQRLTSDQPALNIKDEDLKGLSPKKLRSKEVKKRPKTSCSDTASRSEPECPADLEGLTLYGDLRQYDHDKARYNGMVKLWQEWDVLKVQWKKAYPSMDIVQTVREAHAWELSQNKRKIQRIRFLNSWLARAQDRL